MKTQSHVAWVMVRAIGLICMLYAVTRFIAVAAHGYTAYTLRQHSAIVVRSDLPIPEAQRDTPQNRHLMTMQNQSMYAAGLQGFLMIVSLSAGMYCFKRGEALHRLLLPPFDYDD